VLESEGFSSGKGGWEYEYLNAQGRCKILEIPRRFGMLGGERDSSKDSSQVVVDLPGPYPDRWEDEVQGTKPWQEKIIRGMPTVRGHH